MENIEHYFDWAATSPADEDILTSSLKESMECWANPSSGHTAGKKAREALEKARKSIAAKLGVPESTLYFTSGGTESDQIPLLSVLSKPVKGSVLISSIEHPAIREQASVLTKLGWKVISIPANKEGFITAEAVTSLLTSDTHLVCVMAVNNETGAIQPIYEIADAIKKASEGKRKPKFHVDCVQAAGKIPLKLNYPGIDSAAFSAHKICGPRGIGLLYLKDSIDPFLKGGGQEKGLRSGTENLFGALAFSKCIERYYMTEEKKPEINTKDFVKKLSELKNCTIVPQIRTEKEECFSPYVVQAAFKNIPGNVMLRALDAEGFYISTGSACSTKKANRPVLEAMQIPLDVRETAVRFSFGPKTTQKALDELFEAVKNINNKFQH